MGSSRPEVAALKNGLEQISANLSSQSGKKKAIAREVKELRQKRLDIEAHKENLEMDLKRMKVRFAQGIDGTNDAGKQEVDEEIMLLQAEKQKWDAKILVLQEKLQLVTEAEDKERNIETAMREDNSRQSSQTEEFTTQLQVLTEERDALREGMDQLFDAKGRAEEELENITVSYTHLSDRLNENIDQNRELEDQYQQYENLLEMLQLNMERNRLSPAPPVSPPAAPVSQAYAEEAAPNVHLPVAPLPAVPSVPSAPRAPPPPPPAPPPASAGVGHAVETAPDDASSHYSDEAFEEPDED